MINVSQAIVVEGRYDKSTLLSFLDATVITTGGFSIFNNKEKTWDCPCHGSRFTEKGQLIDNPATDDLK